jgi:hypothetical protein
LKLAVSVLLALALVPAQTPAPPQEPAAPAEYRDAAALLAALPTAAVKPLDQRAALVFTALPLTCIDDLQPRPGATRPYFWQPTYRTVDNYDKTRAFYGCNDWTTSVGATWTLVSLLKHFPEVGSGQLIREKLGAHLGRENLDGELAYFRVAAGAQRPYGYAWFLRLYADLATWKDPDGARYAESAAPLAKFMVDGIVSYLVDLERPNRTAGQTNSALSLELLLDYVDATRDMTIKRAVSDAARRLYLKDTSEPACATKSEAATPEMVSPCLAEAAVMSRVLEGDAFVKWLDVVLPAPQTAAFAPLRAINFEATGTRGGRAGGRGANAGRGGAPGRSDAPAGAATTPPPAAAPARGEATPPAGATPASPAGAPAADAAGPGRGAQTNPRANWIGLAFTRAAEYTAIANALPASDPRVAVFKRLAAIHAADGQREVSTSAAFGAPWVGAYAVSYLSSLGGAK